MDTSYSLALKYSSFLSFSVLHFIILISGSKSVKFAQKFRIFLKFLTLEQWFSTWGPRTPKWSANDFKGPARSKGSARGPPKC